MLFGFLMACQAAAALVAVEEPLSWEGKALDPALGSPMAIIVPGRGHSIC